MKDLDELELSFLHVKNLVTSRNTNVMDQLDTVGVLTQVMEPKSVKGPEDLPLKVVLNKSN